MYAKILTLSDAAIFKTVQMECPFLNISIVKLVLILAFVLNKIIAIFIF